MHDSNANHFRYFRLDEPMISIIYAPNFANDEMNSNIMPTIFVILSIPNAYDSLLTKVSEHIMTVRKDTKCSETMAGDRYQVLTPIACMSYDDVLT